jgi:hypothetical protein
VLFEKLDAMRGRKRFSLVVTPMLDQPRVRDVVPLKIVPGGESSEGFRELKLALRTPSEILQPRVEF